MQLLKIPLSFFIALTALFGYVLHTPEISTTAILCFLSVFILSAGCATLNNVQDRFFDLKMSRTKNRPLPSGKVTVNTALVQSVLLILLGLTGLGVLGSGPSLFGGLVAVLLYNGIYTPLKPRTILAILPGAFCGMMPPLIGWILAGGRTLDLDIITTMLIIGVWQLPHFWLILLYNAKDYSSSCTPSLIKLFSDQQILRIIFIWVLAFALLTLFLPFFKIVFSELGKAILLGNVFFLCSCFAYFCFIKSDIFSSSYRHLFIHLNSAMIIFLLVGIMDKLAVFS